MTLNKEQYAKHMDEPTPGYTWLGLALIATPWILVGGALIKFYLF